MRVQKPARYTGGEIGSISKELADINVCFCFPDTYEIGMSHLGLQVLYGKANAIPNVWCERVFSPWPDMETGLRDSGLPLVSLESGRALKDFDILAFTLQYELCYTNVLNILDLGGIPLRRADRSDKHPIIIAGGPCALNPAPMSSFIDAFVIGDGEEAFEELLQCAGGKNRVAILQQLSDIPGVFVPEYPKKVTKRTVFDLNAAYYPVNPPIPNTEVVHDRVMLELFRGCIRGCRFCQAGFTGRPVRSRSVGTLTKQGLEMLRSSGYDELGLLSLSTSDYEELIELCDKLIEWCEPRKISLSLPSLRIDNFDAELMQRVQSVRKSGLTFAPEAGSQRLRDVINKNVREEDLLNTCRVAFEGGWSTVKLLSHAVLRTWKQYAKHKSRGARITVSTSCFVPKPHTPFQWEAQVAMEEYLRRVELLKSGLKSKAITYKWHSPDQSFIEAALARGDRRMGAVIEAVWEGGARLDSWSECFSLDRWITAFEKCGADILFYALREREYGEILPWSIISSGAGEDHLWRERDKSRGDPLVQF
jgi:radical SAM superfamily enzyme YgiQ (UPF0313 family)